MILIFHGSLREKFGERFELSSRTVADALEGFSTQMKDFPRDLAVEAVGFPTDKSLFEPTDQKEVHILPAMFGGGGKFTSFIIGAVLIVAGIVLLPSALGTSLIVAGSTMILTGIVGLFMKAPSISKSEDPPASKYLGLNQNTTAAGTPITLAWGRIALGGHWLSLQSDADKLTQGVFPTNPT